jgi:hypothetical protein
MHRYVLLLIGRDLLTFAQGQTNNFTHPALHELYVKGFFGSTTALGMLFPDEFEHEVPEQTLAFLGTCIIFSPPYLQLLRGRFCSRSEQFSTNWFMELKKRLSIHVLGIALSTKVCTMQSLKSRPTSIIAQSVKAWSKRSGDKVEVGWNYRNDERDEVEGSKGIGNEKRT